MTNCIIVSIYKHTVMDEMSRRKIPVHLLMSVANGYACNMITVLYNWSCQTACLMLTYLSRCSCFGSKGKRQAHSLCLSSYSVAAPAMGRLKTVAFWDCFKCCHRGTTWPSCSMSAMVRQHVCPQSKRLGVFADCLSSSSRVWGVLLLLETILSLIWMITFI